MRKGRIINRHNFLEIPGELWGDETGSTLRFKIDGTDTTNTLVSADWEFQEDKPTGMDQFRALPAGAKFTYEGVADKTGVTRIKLDDEHYAYISTSSAVGWDILNAFEYVPDSIIIQIED